MKNLKYILILLVFCGLFSCKNVFKSYESSLTVSAVNLGFGAQKEELDLTIEASGVDWIIENETDWIVVPDTMGSGNKTMTVSIDRSGFIDGQYYTGKLLIKDIDDEGSQVVMVSARATFNGNWSASDSLENAQISFTILGTLAQLTSYAITVPEETIADAADSLATSEFDGEDLSFTLANGAVIEAELLNTVSGEGTVVYKGNEFDLRVKKVTN